MCPQVASKLLAPVTQRGLVNIEPHAIFTERLHHDMHVRMRLIRMQHQRVSMFEPELLTSEVADSR